MLEVSFMVLMFLQWVIDQKFVCLVLVLDYMIGVFLCICLKNLCGCLDVQVFGFYNLKLDRLGQIVLWVGVSWVWFFRMILLISCMVVFDQLMNVVYLIKVELLVWFDKG